MTLFRLSFAGQVKKAEHRQAGGKSVVALSLCQKSKGRNGAEDSFTWVRVNVWDAPDWMAPRLIKGAFIAGSGRFELVSYEGKDGKRYSAEVRCSGFDIEVGAEGDGEGAGESAPQRPARPAPPPKATPPADDEPPF